MTMKRYTVTLAANADNPLIPGYRQTYHFESDGRWVGSWNPDFKIIPIDPALMSWRDVQTVELEAESVWDAQKKFHDYLVNGDDCATRIR